MIPSSGFKALTNVGATAVLVETGPLHVTAVRAWQTGLAADAFVQLFDAASADDVTVGTTAPSWVVMTIFGAGPVSSGDGLPTHGLLFQRGLVIASTTTPTGSVANTQQVRITYV